MFSISDDSFLVHLHKKRLQTFLSQDCENGFFDISFDIDGNILHAHKFVIASISETFKELFRKQSSSSFNADQIPIDNCSFKDFRAFVLFAYTGEWTLMTNERILKMLQIAFVYQSEEFHQKCDIYLSKITFTVESFYHFYDSLADCIIIGF
uniref:BTB domain-containing protein n=1 Tax=Panagrolaimus superbus TaxID=310955 RepID=A0A914YAY6_9BILA